MKIWIRLLLDGYHKFIYAGNDAHGNFNMYRQIKTPMLSLYEKKEQLFGEFRTGVFTKKDLKFVLNYNYDDEDKMAEFLEESLNWEHQYSVSKPRVTKKKSTYSIYN